MRRWPAPTAPAPVHATVDRSRLEVADQPRAGARRAGRRAGRRTSTISGALRSRDTDLMIGALRTLGLRVDGPGTDADVSAAAIDPGADATHRLRPGGHGAAVRATAGRAERRRGHVRRRRAGPRPADRATARCAAPLSVVVDGTALPFVVRGRGSVAGGTVEIDASASSQFVSGLLLSGAAFTGGLTVVAHRRQRSVDAAHRDDGGDAARRGRRGRRLASEPLAGGARPDRRPALADRARPEQRRAVSGGGGGDRRRGARHSLAIGQHATGRCHPGSAAQAGLHCAANRFVPRAAGTQFLGGIDADLRDVGELTPAVAALAALAGAGVGVPVDRDRSPARPRDRPACRAVRRDQQARRRLRRDRRRAGDHRGAAARRHMATPTPTTGWRWQGRSSACGYPE